MKISKLIDRIIIIVLAIYLLAIFISFIRLDNTKFDKITFYHHGVDSEQLADLHDRVLRLVETSKLYDEELSYKVILTKSFAEFTLWVPIYRRAFGGSLPIFNINVVAPSLIKENKVTRNSAKNNRRKLDSTIAHEIIHVLIRKKYGTIKSLFFSKWKVEGYADYITMDSSFGEEAGVELFCAAKKHDSSSFKYFKYRKYITYLMNEGNSFDEIIEKDFELSEVEQKIRNTICQMG